MIVITGCGTDGSFYSFTALKFNLTTLWQRVPLVYLVAVVLLYPGEEKVCEDGVGGWAGHQQREGRGGVQAGLRAEAEHVQQAAAAHGAHAGLEFVKRSLVNGQTQLLFIRFLLLPKFREIFTN